MVNCKAYNYLYFFQGNTNVSSLRDCNNECNGTAQIAECGVCLMRGKVNPFLDCNNNCFGNASLDKCGVCTGGNTSLMANYLKDACGKPAKTKFLLTVTFIKASFRHKMFLRVCKVHSSSPVFRIRIPISYSTLHERSDRRSALKSFYLC